MASFHSLDDSLHFCIISGFVFYFFERHCSWYSIRAYIVGIIFSQILFFWCCGTRMSAHVISRVFGISSRPIDQLTVVGHESKFPPVHSWGSLLVVLKDAYERFMISNNRKLGTINIQMKMFHSPYYGKHLSLCLGVATFHITQSTACITKNFAFLY